MLSIDDGPARLRAAVAAVGQLPRELRAELREQTRDVAVPLMRAAVARHGSSTGDPRWPRLAQRATYRPYRDVPGVAFGGARALMHDGKGARFVARAMEYGSPGTRRVRLRVRSPKGGTYSVTRHTTRNWRPDRGPLGVAVGPAALDVAPKVVDVWVGLVERLTVRAMDGG